MRTRKCEHTLPHNYQVTAVTFNDNAEQVFSGGLDNDVHVSVRQCEKTCHHRTLIHDGANIQVWDLRKGAELMTLSGHTDTITCVRLSPDGKHLMTNAMDNTVRAWDVRPFCAGERCVKVRVGPT